MQPKLWSHSPIPAAEQVRAKQGLSAGLGALLPCSALCACTQNSANWSDKSYSVLQPMFYKLQLYEISAQHEAEMNSLFQKDQNLRLLFIVVVVVAASKIFEAKASDLSSCLYKFLSLLLLNPNIALISQGLRLSESSLLHLQASLLLPETCQVNETSPAVWTTKALKIVQGV